MQQGILEAYDPPPPLPPARGYEPPSTIGENLRAGWDEMFLVGNTTARDNAESARWQEQVDELNAARPRGAPRFRNPLTARASNQMRDQAGFGEMAYQREAARVLAAIAAARGANPQAFAGVPIEGAASFRRWSDEQDRPALDAIRDVQSRATTGGAIAGFVGQMGGSFADPVNIAAMGIPGGGMTGTVGRRVLGSALANATAEAAVQPQVGANYRALGEEYGLGEAAASVAVAGAFGGALQVAGEGAAALVRGGRARRDARTLASARERAIQALPAERREEGAALDDGELADALEHAWRYSWLTPPEEDAVRALRGDADRSIRRLSESELAAATRAATLEDRALVGDAEEAIGAENLTREERFAARTLRRGWEIDEASPFDETPATAGEHRSRLAEAYEALNDGRLPDDMPGTGAETPDLSDALDAAIAWAPRASIAPTAPGGALSFGRPLDEGFAAGSPFGDRTHPILGGRRFHNGIDFRAPLGTPVRATARGRVTFAGYEGANGNKVVIDHGGGIVTVSIHLDTIGVRVGDEVDGAVQIGTVGSTGRYADGRASATGPHLHYTMYRNGEPIDPIFGEAGPAGPLPRRETAAEQPTGSAAHDAFRRSVRQRDNARNPLPGQSAAGRYDFTEPTWVAMFRRAHPGTHLDDAAIWDRVGDGDLQERVMDATIAYYEDVFAREGVAATAANMRLGHMVGAERAARLIEADPDRSIADFLTAEEIADNGDLYAGRSVGEVIDDAHAAVGAVPRGPGESGVPQLRADAAEPATAGEWAFGGARPVFAAGRIYRIDVRNILTDPETMQFRVGGDSQGVVDTLRHDPDWDDELASLVYVYERSDGTLIVADGHQRTGLARRLIASGRNPDGIMVDVRIWREDDGITVGEAMFRAARRNVAEGHVDAFELARIMRIAPEGRDVRSLVRSRAMLNTVNGMARLGDDAWGLVLNGYVSNEQAGIVGRTFGDRPERQVEAMRELRNAGDITFAQAQSMVDELAASPTRVEHQASLYGDVHFVRTLLREKAKIRSRAEVILRGDAFTLSRAAHGADVLEAAGSTIARVQALQAAARTSNLRELLKRLSITPGNPVFEALNRSATRFADGDALDDATHQFIAELAAAGDSILDELGGGRPGDPGGGGRRSDAGGARDDEAPGALSDEQGGPSLEELEAAGQSGFDIFDDPHGPGGKTVADSLEHDARMDVDAGDDTVYRLGEGDERTKAGVIREIDADEAAIMAARDCL